MKTLRKTYPKCREYVKAGRTYYMVDLRRKHYQGPKWKNFTDKNSALFYAAQVGDKVNKSGIDSITQFDPRITAWGEQFAVYGKTLEQAIETALGVFESERKVKESPYMAELLSVWVLDKVENKLKPLRPKTLKTIRTMAETFKNDFSTSRIKEITKSRVDEYLQKKDVSNQTRKNICSYLSQFFNWAKSKQYHTENPAEQIEIHVANRAPEYFTVEQCIKIMSEANQSENKSMLAYFALCLFGGIRPDEVERMNWMNVNMETKEIYLPATITKTKKDRLFSMSNNLFNWLSTCDRNKPLVLSANVKNNRVKVCKGLGFPWIQDGMRHTFATFHYAKYKSLEELRHIMGNSPGVIEKFYRGTIAQAEIEKFWGIHP